MTERKPKENHRGPRNVGEGPVAFRLAFGERVRSVLDEFATRSDAARIADVTPEHLASYIAGRAKPPFELMARLAAARHISLDWLATGLGQRSTLDDEPDGFVAVALQPEADATFGQPAPEAPYLFSRSWLGTTIGVPAERLRIVIHRGNANEPAIRDGDALIVDTTVMGIAEDGLYVFPRDGRFLARFVETFLDGRVALKARNPDYGVQVLSPEDAGKLLLLGRVRWRGGAA